MINVLLCSTLSKKSLVPLPELIDIVQFIDESLCHMTLTMTQINNLNKNAQWLWHQQTQVAVNHLMLLMSHSHSIRDFIPAFSDVSKVVF